MKQEIFEDPYLYEDWDLQHSSRCFVHLANSLAWEMLTGKKPPTAPITAATYAKYGIPWFDHYDENATAVPATETLAGIKSVAQIDKAKGGASILPENVSIPTPKKVIQTKDQRPHLRDGEW